MNPDWQQPFIFLFEWGMFILGWTVVAVMAFLALIIIFAFLRATWIVVIKKSKQATKSTVKSNGGSLDDDPPKL